MKKQNMGCLAFALWAYALGVMSMLAVCVLSETFAFESRAMVQVMSRNGAKSSQIQDSFEFRVEPLIVHCDTSCEKHRVHPQ